MNTKNDDVCQKPCCTSPVVDTYEDEHGNTLDLCDVHYYRLVSGGKTQSINHGIRFDTGRRNPFDKLDLDEGPRFANNPCPDIPRSGRQR